MSLKYQVVAAYAATVAAQNPTCDDVTCHITEVCTHGVVEDMYWIENDTKKECAIEYTDWLANPDAHAG